MNLATSREDPELCRRLSRRDPSVMGEIYDSYGRVAYSVIFRMVGNIATSEDLLQETFLRVWTCALSFDPNRGPLGPWIIRIARNLTIDFLRSRQGRIMANAVDVTLLEMTYCPWGTADYAVTIDQTRRLRTALKTLPSMQRGIIELAYHEGLSQSEIATRLNQPLGTIKTWTRLALKTLRLEISGSEADVRVSGIACDAYLRSTSVAG